MLCILSPNCARNIASHTAANMHHNNAVDNKRNDNVVASVRVLNSPANLSSLNFGS